MKWNITLLIGLCMILLVVPAVHSAILHDVPASDWIVTKKTGDETFLNEILAYNENNTVIDLDFSEAPPQTRGKIIANQAQSSASTERKDFGTFVRFIVQNTPQHDYLQFGSNTILIEENDYWAIENKKRTYYISKTGFQLSNEPDNSYANIQWVLDIEGNEYNSAENIWDWSYTNTTDMVNLTGKSVIHNESLEWIVNYNLKDKDEYITVTLTTNDTSANYYQMFKHTAINVSNNTVPDLLYTDNKAYVPRGITQNLDKSSNGNNPSQKYTIFNLDEDQDIDVYNTTSFKIKDSRTNKFIELLYNDVSDAILNIQKSYASIFSQMKTLVMFWRDPVDRQALFGDNFAFSNKTTASTTYEDIGTNIFNVSRTTPMFVTTSFQVTRDTGTTTKRDYSWRILLDGVEIINLTQSLELKESVPLVIQRSLGVLSAGQHNITFQHKVSQDILTTSGITFSVTTLEFQNGTTLDGTSNITSINVTETLPTLKKSVDFNKISENSSVFINFFGQASTSNSNVDLNIYGQVGSQQTGEFSQHLDDSSDIKVMTYTWIFDDIPQGNNTIDLYAYNTQNSKISFFDGSLTIIELQKDDIATNLVTDTVGSFSTSSVTYVNVSQYQLNTSNESLILLSSQMTVTKDTSGKDNITLRYCVEGAGCGFEHVLELEGASDIGNLGFITTSNNPLGIQHNNITLQMKVTAGTTSTITNVSNYAFEKTPLDSFLVLADNPPITLLQSPLNNTVSNQENNIFECSATDDAELSSMSLYHNLSGSFVSVQTKPLSGSSDSTSFFENIVFNNTIEWNCLATDNATQSSFSANNYTLSTLQPNYSTVLDIISPVNNSLLILEKQFGIFDRDIGFKYEIGENATCILYANNSVVDQETVLAGEILHEFQPSLLPNGNIDNTYEVWYQCNLTNFPSTALESEHRIVSIQYYERPQEYSLAVCPTTSLTHVLMYAIFLILSFTLMILAPVFRSGLIGFLGALMLFILSGFLIYCILAVGIIMIGVSLLLMVMFIFKGVKGDFLR